MGQIINKKFSVLMELAEYLAEFDLAPFDIKKDVFPIVVPIEQTAEGPVFHPYVSLADFETPDFIVEINRILGWHEKFVNEGMDPYLTQTLRMSRVKLAALLKELGEFRSTLKKNYTDLDFLRRRVRDKTMLLKKSEGLTATESQAHARLMCEDYDHKVSEAEKQWHDVCALYDAVNQTLNAMAGEISALQTHQNAESFAERTKAPAA